MAFQELLQERRENFFSPRIAPRFELGFAWIGRERSLKSCSENSRDFQELLQEWHSCSNSMFSSFSKVQGALGSARLQFVHGTVRAVPIFGSDGSSLERGFLCFKIVETERDRSGSGFGS